MARSKQPRAKSGKKAPEEAIEVGEGSSFADRLLAAVRKGFGSDSATMLGDDTLRSKVDEVVPTGVDVIDQEICGIGGLPVGRLTELFSAEGGGKTTLMLSACACVQREPGGLAVIVESEGALMADRAAALGVDVSRLVVLQPDTMEEALGMLEDAIDQLPDGEGPLLLAWDSVASAPTKAEVEDGVTGDAAVGDRARLLSRACRVLAAKVSSKRIALLFINQIRDKIGVTFGDKTTTPGGNAIRFYASLRIEILGGAGVKDGETHTGKDITVLSRKNKLAPPFRKVRVRLNYLTGWDNTWSTINHAKDFEVIPQAAQYNAASLARARLALGWDKPAAADEAAE